MEGDPRVDELMRPVRAAIERHIKDPDAKTDIYNRAYEALIESMDALDVSAEVTAKQIAESAKNLQRAESAEAKVRELEAAARWIPVSERQPEEGQEVIVMGHGGFVCNWRHSNRLAQIFTRHWTHWIPQPPKPQEVEG